MKTKLALLFIDLLVLSASCLISLHFFQPPSNHPWLLFGVLVGSKLFFFLRMGLYHAILRFAGLRLATTTLQSVFFASFLSFCVFFFLSPSSSLAGFFLMDYLLTIFTVGLTRFAPRYFSEPSRGYGSKRTVIYGAGELGDEVARRLLRDPGEYHLVGFIDDESSKVGKRVHGLPIFGTMSQLQRILHQHRISELIIAISSLSGEAIRSITQECRKNHVFCRIVPSFPDILKKEMDIQNLDISDLLKREPKDLDQSQIRHFLSEKTILITGAGGSIGSELARQCLTYQPKKIILVDHSEYNLYRLEEEFGSVKVPLRFCLLNILQRKDVERVIQEERPSLIFHAAAYKHVPIVEDNPFEGIRNNVWGTIEMTELAKKYGAEKFILISTDKAVRPTNIMGASKRICELYIQNSQLQSGTEFIAVRFGNVLGSSGSVIPKFIEQINQGGPVTITHPEVTRYFMLTSEAVQLVLQAASIGKGGEIFILNMGKPVRIYEMAEDLIFLSGREPHKDIEITITGLRPGEKLYEELLLDDMERKTQYQNIMIAKAARVNWLIFNQHLEQLKNSIEASDRQALLAVLKRIVPEFNHSELKDLAPQDHKTVRQLYMT